MKKRNKFLAVCITILIAVFCIGAVSAMADDNIRPKKVSIPKSKMTVTQGSEFEIHAVMRPANAEDDYLRWEIVSGKSYVKFKDNDRSGDDIDLIAKKPGTAKIRCYVKGKKKSKYGDTITVVVRKKEAAYSLSPKGRTVITVEQGDDFDLEVKKSSSTKNSQLKWTISDKRIVGFEDRHRKGKEVDFVAKRLGTVTITCTCTNKKANPKQITFTVKVVPDYDDDDD